MTQAEKLTAARRALADAQDDPNLGVAIDEFEAAIRLLKVLSVSPVVFAHRGVNYVEVQIDLDTWDQLKAYRT